MHFQVLVFTDAFYHAAAVTFTNTLPASIAGSDDKSGTIRVHGTNVSLYNLNIINPSGNVRVEGCQLPAT